ncbi:hypothetical protein CVT26_004390, partial [Gymnopilus dilepis]
MSDPTTTTMKQPDPPSQSQFATTPFSSSAPQPSTSTSVRPAGPASSNADPGPGPSSSDPPNPVESIEIQTRCNGVIEAYRSVRFGKTTAILKLQQVIASASPSALGDAAFKALESYIRILDNFDAFRNSAGERGAALAGNTRPEGEQGGDSDEGEVPPAQKRRGREMVEEDDDEAHTSRRKIDTRTFTGLSRKKARHPVCHQKLGRQPLLSRISLGTPNSRKRPSPIHQGVPSSPILNGQISLQAVPLTSTMFFPVSTPSRQTHIHENYSGHSKSSPAPPLLHAITHQTTLSPGRRTLRLAYSSSLAGE